MLEIGSTIGGLYKVLHVLGEGGMSTVYLVMNVRANKQWAAKEVMKEKISGDRILRQNLTAETEILKGLHHKNLPSIADILDLGDSYVLIMDYIEGKTLREYLIEQGTPDQASVVSWAMQLCDVLSYLHTQDPPIIYRDTKPANIMLKPDGTVVLIDFGTARLFKDGNIEDTICLGTKGYAAPEQYGSNGQTDARTDIYNLGATIYHLLTGHSPAMPPYEILPIRKWNSALSSGLEQIVLKCTKQNPDERYQSAAELSFDLQNYAALDVQEQRKAKKRVLAVSIIALISVFSFILSGIFGHLASKTQNTSYDALLRTASMSEAYADKREAYEKAIQLDPSSGSAYQLFLEDAILSDGVFSSEESSDLLRITGYKAADSASTSIESLKKDSDEYDLFCYNTGLAYFYYYDGDGNKSLSKPWFEIAKDSETLPDAKKIRAEKFYNISSYYNKLLQTDKAGDSSVSYKEYWEDLKDLVSGNLAQQDNVQTATVAYRECLYQIGNHASDFYKAGVKSDELESLVQTIQQRIKTDITPYSSDESLADTVDFALKNIEALRSATREDGGV